MLPLRELPALSFGVRPQHEQLRSLPGTSGARHVHLLLRRTRVGGAMARRLRGHAPWRYDALRAPDPCGTLGATQPGIARSEVVGHVPCAGGRTCGSANSCLRSWRGSRVVAGCKLTSQSSGCSSDILVRLLCSLPTAEH